MLADEARNIYGFRRSFKQECMEGYINNMDADQWVLIEVSKSAADLLTGKVYKPVRGRIKVHIPAKAGVIIKV